MHQRIYVEMDVSFLPDGQMRPRALSWENGRRYKIDRVLDVRPSFAEKAGGQGDRYKVMVKGQERYLFFEHNPDCYSSTVGRWFIETQT